jgi:hypothetical protein
MERTTEMIDLEQALEWIVEETGVSRKQAEEALRKGLSSGLISCTIENKELGTTFEVTGQEAVACCNAALDEGHHTDGAPDGTTVN